MEKGICTTCDSMGFSTDSPKDGWVRVFRCLECCTFKSNEDAAIAFYRNVQTVGEFPLDKTLAEVTSKYTEEEYTLSYSVRFTPILGIIPGGVDFSDHDKLREILAENFIGYIKTAIDEDAGELANLITNIKLVLVDHTGAK